MVMTTLSSNINSECRMDERTAVLFHTTCRVGEDENMMRYKSKKEMFQVRSGSDHNAEHLPRPCWCRYLLFPFAINSFCFQETHRRDFLTEETISIFQHLHISLWGNLHAGTCRSNIYGMFVNHERAVVDALLGQTDSLQCSVCQVYSSPPYTIYQFETHSLKYEKILSSNCLKRTWNDPWPFTGAPNTKQASVISHRPCETTQEKLESFCLRLLHVKTKEYVCHMWDERRWMQPAPTAVDVRDCSW